MRCVFLSGALLALSACSSWQSVHDEAASMRSDLSACTPSDTCVTVGGFNGDCTGVLGCPFAVRANAKEEAESRGRELADKSRGFSMCAEAFCNGPGQAHCDVDAGHCTLVY